MILFFYFMHALFRALSNSLNKHCLRTCLWKEYKDKRKCTGWPDTKQKTQTRRVGTDERRIWEELGEEKEYDKIYCMKMLKEII